MNPLTLHKISYGLYIVSTKDGDKLNGQIANTVFQVTSKPIKFAISICKENLTHEMIERSKILSVSILPESAKMEFIGLFGFKSGRDINKFEKISYRIGKTGAPIITENSAGYLDANVINQLDVGTHTLFICEAVDCDILSDENPMTYEYYHKVIKGKAPKTSPTYIKEEIKEIQNNEKKLNKYICKICGYTYDPENGDPDSGIAPKTAFEDIPEDWVCPVCGASKRDFEIVI